MSDRFTDNIECGAALTRIARGDASALNVIYDRLAKKIFSLSFSILKEKCAAEDAMQETFLRLLRFAGEYKKGESARAWIMAVARNAAIDLLRKRRPTESDDALESVAVQSDFSEAIEMNEILSALDDLDRDIVVLKAVDGFRFKEIGTIVGLSPDAAQKRYRRAIEKLKPLLK